MFTFKKFVKDTLLYTFISALFIMLFVSISYDDTDDVENGTHSGMWLYTDHLTKCQYLGAGVFGGITPRLNKFGDHVGCVEQFLFNQEGLNDDDH